MKLILSFNGAKSFAESELLGNLTVCINKYIDVVAGCAEKREMPINELKF